MTFDWTRGHTPHWTTPPATGAFRSVLCGRASNGRCLTCGARIESTGGQHFRLVPLTNGVADAQG